MQRQNHFISRKISRLTHAHGQRPTTNKTALSDLQNYLESGRKALAFYTVSLPLVVRWVLQTFDLAAYKWKLLRTSAIHKGSKSGIQRSKRWSIFRRHKRHLSVVVVLAISALHISPLSATHRHFGLKTEYQKNAEEELNFIVKSDLQQERNLKCVINGSAAALHEVNEIKRNLLDYYLTLRTGDTPQSTFLAVGGMRYKLYQTAVATSSQPVAHKVFLRVKASAVSSNGSWL